MKQVREGIIFHGKKINKHKPSWDLQYILFPEDH